VTSDLAPHPPRSATPVMRTPRTVDVEITGRCNLRCAYCYFHDDRVPEHRDVSTPEWLRFIDELGGCGVMRVRIGGGEPFLRRDLPVLIQRVVANRMRFSLVSNGSRITDAVAALIGSTRRCDFVQISVDGSSAATHDILRGPGSFLGAIRGIRVLQRHGVPVTARLTTHHRNIDDLEAAARFLLEDLELDWISTNAACELGASRMDPLGISMTPADHQGALNVMRMLDVRYGDRIEALAGPMRESRVWPEVLRRSDQKLPPLPREGALTGCQTMHSTIAVRSDGSYLPCIMMRLVPIGVINHDSLIDVWQNSPVLREMRHRESIRLSDFECCHGCSHVPYCRGGCPAAAHSLTGKFNYPDTTTCLRQAVRDGLTLEMEDIRTH
jgi:SynChlorMet cassette radical SAM/SPASM protein ScmE